jgi:hypothetical protein
MRQAGITQIVKMPQGLRKDVMDAKANLVQPEENSIQKNS